MDPNACYDRLCSEDPTDRYWAAQDLLGWMRRGGFAPDQWNGTRDELRLCLANIRQQAQRAGADTL